MPSQLAQLTSRRPCRRRRPGANPPLPLPAASGRRTPSLLCALLAGALSLLPLLSPGWPLWELRLPWEMPGCTPPAGAAAGAACPAGQAIECVESGRGGAAAGPDVSACKAMLQARQPGTQCAACAATSCAEQQPPLGAPSEPVDGGGRAMSSSRRGGVGSGIGMKRPLLWASAARGGAGWLGVQGDATPNPAGRAMGRLPAASAASSLVMR